MLVLLAAKKIIEIASYIFFLLYTREKSSLFVVSLLVACDHLFLSFTLRSLSKPKNSSICLCCPIYSFTILQSAT